MLEVRGFRAIRYDRHRVGTLDNVVTPPFDVIGPEDRAMLSRRSPYNMVHLILPEERDGFDKYASAGDYFETWLREGILKQDAEESFYLLEQTFRGPDGRERVRRGFFAVARLPQKGEEIILGHERTFRKKIEDRLQLTAATKANLGSVFVLYGDPENRLAPFLAQMHERPEDDLAHTFEGTTNRVWRVPYDPAVTEFFRDKKLYIADGHHRFATACEYGAQMRAKEPSASPRPYDYVMMGFVAFNDPGLAIYPPHRVVDMPAGFELETFLKIMEPWFVVEKVDGDLHSLVETRDGCVIGAVIREAGQFLFTLRDIDRKAFLGDDHGEAWRNLDMAVLHRGIIERALGFPEGSEFIYETDAQKAVRLVTNGSKGLAFLLKPTRPEQVKDCAEAGEKMPEKATYFFPKLPSGAVIHRLV